jgi:hypothetical protein
MRCITIIGCVVVGLGQIVAQGGSFTSPRGLDAREGNSMHWGILFQTPQRLQQVDNTQRGNPANVASIAFRRDGDRLAPDAGARTFDLTVRMAHAICANIGGTFAGNYRGGASSTVFAKKTVSFPDWTAPVPGPAAFDFVVPLDSTWAYDGQDALLWEVVVEAPSKTGNVFVDREWIGGTFAIETGRTIGSGCVSLGTSPFQHRLRLYNYGPSDPRGMQLESAGGNAPPNENIWLNLGVSDPGLVLPGLCESVHALPIVTVNAGVSTAVGEVRAVPFPVPYAPGLVGVPLYTQLVAADATQSGLPLSLSNGQIARMPPAPIPIECAYLYGAPSATSATLFASRGIVARLSD